MRLDKYLKVSRIIKRRTVANEACDNGRIEVNGRVVKASYDVKIGDVMTISMGKNPITVKVLSITEMVGKENAKEMYEVIS
ncbi:MAG: RNA-binding S4 domain-containing protein [Clostridia bacterium]|nr:RNA-binding S4 domain-containing protein [Clostridia bacterium]